MHFRPTSVPLRAADVIAKVERYLGGKLDGPATVHVVRDVAPTKLMLCVSFKVPEAVAFGEAGAAPPGVVAGGGDAAAGEGLGAGGSAAGPADGQGEGEGERGSNKRQKTQAGGE